jgi:cytochrome P450
MSTRPPVNDWETDFDHLDPRWVNDPYPIWQELRAQCPVAHTERYMGVYFPTRYDDVRAVAYDTEHFSSRRIVVRETPPPRIPAPPITSDPPGHRGDKNLLLPAFTPDQIQRHEPRARAICAKLIDKFADKGGCDAAVDYAQELPVRMIAHMMGLPEEEGDLFRRWIHDILVAGITQPALMMRAIGETSVYFNAEIEKRKRTPGDDLISYLAAVRVDGLPLASEHILGSLRLVLVAGIDTTWSAIGSCFWHLARHPEDRRRLVAEPDLIPTAVEEFLRAYAPVTMAREVVKETTIGGCPFKPGQMVLLSFPAANRDPKMFPDAERVVIDRTENRHAAFGLGIHRCIGSNLARMEIKVTLQEWLKRIPEFSLAPGAEVTWSEGTVRGPRKLPVVFG